jgi:hypothetical protein
LLPAEALLSPLTTFLIFSFFIRLQDFDVDWGEDAEGLKNLEVYKSRQVTRYKQMSNSTTLGYLESKINKTKHEDKFLKYPRFELGQQIHFLYGRIG